MAEFFCLCADVKLILFPSLFCLFICLFTFTVAVFQNNWHFGFGIFEGFLHFFWFSFKRRSLWWFDIESKKKSKVLAVGWRTGNVLFGFGCSNGGCDGWDGFCFVLMKANGAGTKWNLRKNERMWRLQRDFVRIFGIFKDFWVSFWFFQDFARIFWALVWNFGVSLGSFEGFLDFFEKSLGYLGLCKDFLVSFGSFRILQGFFGLWHEMSGFFYYLLKDFSAFVWNFGVSWGSFEGFLVSLGKVWDFLVSLGKFWDFWDCVRIFWFLLVLSGFCKDFFGLLCEISAFLWAKFGIFLDCVRISGFFFDFFRIFQRFQGFCLTFRRFFRIFWRIFGFPWRIFRIVLIFKDLSKHFDSF